MKTKKRVLSPDLSRTAKRVIKKMWRNSDALSPKPEKIQSTADEEELDELELMVVSFAPHARMRDSRYANRHKRKHSFACC